MSAAKSPAVVAEKAPTSSKDTKKLFGTIEVSPFVLRVLALVVLGYVFVGALYNAYRIRTYALTEYGMVIHEFDPWFNFRATQYLSKHGWHAFFHWFDHMSWYPLGRPVGTTIYPGLQLTSVAIHRVLRWMGPAYRMSLNDICCTLPCWFGSLSTLILSLITYEASSSLTAATISAWIFAIIPAHIMRTVGGGYDNECIAIAAMLSTFYFWIRSIRTTSSWPIGVVAGLAYGYMVAAWGGYVFVLNMVALHCAAIVLLDWVQNKYDPTLAKAYSLFYVIGTAIALCVPPVGYAPFKSLEQIFALLVFIFINVLHVSEGARKKADVEVLSQATFRIRVKYVSVTCGALFVFAFAIAPSGFFGPLSSRVRGLFLQHTRTGNPLVDSVAEHQPANADAYWHYLHIAFNGWMIGLFMLPYAIYTGKNSRAMTFLFSYGIVAYYFSLKMARLILLSGPVAASLSAIILALMVEWSVAQFIWSEADEEEEKLALQGKDSQTRKVAVKKSSNENDFENSLKKIKMAFKGYKHMRLGLAALVLLLIGSGALSGPFERHSENMAHSFSNPQLMFKSRLNNGNVVMIDDYREAYFWLRDKTPEDSRVMAWWDYGYQITGIGNRTSIADGNTWNHEHIATLGKCLTSPVKEAHGLIRHLADYVLIWSGGGGDDLAKSPHMARIGNSVYRDICPKDPLCQHFGFQGANHENPTPMMRKSLLYNLHAHNVKPNVHVDPTMFQDVFSSKYGLVRIFKVMNVSQESKDWLANPANRICDAPGSWYCNGQYPPAPEIQELLAKRRDFGQLEDFNRKNRDDDYHRAYMQRMGGGAH